MKKVLIVLVLLCLLVAGTVFLISQHSGNDTVVVLETNHIQVLPPHEHNQGDSPDDPEHHVEVTSKPLIAEQDLRITGFDAELVNAPPEVVHHGSVYRMDEKSFTCPQVPRELATMSQDQMYNPHVRFPDGYAMLIPKGTPLFFGGALHNPLPPVGAGGTYHDVFVRITIHIAPADEKNLTPVEFHLLHLDDAACASNPLYAFTVPAHMPEYRYSGPSGTSSPSRYVFPTDATIFYMGAHLHGWQGGQELIVRKNAETIGDFKTAKATWERYLYETPHSGTSLEVSKGDELSIAAIYENPGETPERGAMGILGVYSAER